MKVVLISHAMVVPSTWSKSVLLARSVDLVTVIPSGWDTFGNRPAEVPEHFETLPTILPNRNHFHFYPFVYDLLAKKLPDLIHIDEEPYSLVTAHIISIANRLGIPAIAFTWQNIYKSYPLPFSLLERYVLGSLRGLICGNSESEEVFLRKGFKGASTVIPQFGVECGNFCTKDWSGLGDYLQIAFAGRLVAEKGVDLLIEAVARLPFVRASIAGTGPEEKNLRLQAQRLGVSARVDFVGALSGKDMPQFLSESDVLLLPSRTTPAWKEQFGRVLVEAMASGTVVLGSNSGEIPNVIRDAGLVFQENDVGDLCNKLVSLRSKDLRRDFGTSGIERAKKNFTQEKIVADTLTFYNHILK